MTARRVMLMAVVAVMAGAASTALVAQTGFSRVVLQDQPLSIPGRHTVTARAEFAPGASAGMHTHPGEEMGYVLEGSVELTVEGRPVVVLKPGDAFFIPAGVPHNGRNLGQVPSALLSVFLAEQGKPLATPVK